MRNVIGFVAAFAIGIVAASATQAWAKPKGHAGNSVCDCGCGVQGGIYSVSVSAPNNDPSQCGNLNKVDCTMGPSAGSNNQGKLQDCKGSVVVGKPTIHEKIKVTPGPSKNK